MDYNGIWFFIINFHRKKEIFQFNIQGATFDTAKITADRKIEKLYNFEKTFSFKRNK